MTDSSIQAAAAPVTADGRGAELGEVSELSNPELYVNRELSWLDFNDRVLQLAEDESVPLLERVKFCAIYASNLDEFFMVRVAGLQEYVDAGVERPREDGRSPAETIAAIGDAVRRHSRRLTACLDG